jgi:tetratricopeptide (TPR) repeat protein
MYSKAPNKAQLHASILKEYQTNAEANPKDSMLNFSLGYAYLTLGSGLTPTPSEEEQQKAIYYIKLANSNDPNNLWPYWGLKIVYSKQSIMGKHMYDEAIAICKKALKIDENNAKAHYELGEAYNENYDVNMKNEAMQEYRKAVQLDPNYTEAHFRLGSIYRVKNMYERASEEYNKVIELDPTGPLANDAKRSLIHIERSKGEL